MINLEGLNKEDIHKEDFQFRQLSFFLRKVLHQTKDVDVKSLKVDTIEYDMICYNIMRAVMIIVDIPKEVKDLNTHIKWRDLERVNNLFHNSYVSVPNYSVVEDFLLKQVPILVSELEDFATYSLNKYPQPVTV